MFDMGAETMALPLEEKMKFEQGDDGMSHGCVCSVMWSHFCIDAMTSDTKLLEQTPQMLPV